MLKLCLAGYSDAYIPASGTVTGVTTGTTAKSNNRKNIIIENCAPFTNCISEINNTQIDNSKDIDIVMPMYNLIEYSNLENIWKFAFTSGSLWQYLEMRYF